MQQLVELDRERERVELCRKAGGWKRDDGRSIFFLSYVNCSSVCVFFFMNFVVDMETKQVEF